MLSPAEMARLVAEKDWSQTPLGPREQWPLNLRVVVDLLLAHPNPIILLWGPDLVQIYNDGYRVIAGTKHPSALGQPTKECWPEVWDFVAPLYRQVMEQGKAVSIEESLVRLIRSGDEPEDAYISASYGPVWGENGHVAGIFTTVHDATEKVQVEQARRESEARSRLLTQVVNHSPDFIGVSDVEGRVVYANDVALRLVGLTMAETVDYAVPDYFVERELIRDVVLPAVLRDGRWAGEVHLRNIKAGTSVPVNYDVFRVDDPETGQPLSFATIMHDLTPEKQAQAELAEARRRVEAALMAGEVGTYYWDILADRVFGDRNFIPIFGVPLDEQNSAPLSAFVNAIHPDDRDRVSTLIQQTLETDIPFKAEYRIVNARGERWVIARGQVERDAQGRPCGWAGVIVDITERKQAGERLSESEQQLRLVTDHIPALVGYIDSEMRYQFVNSAYHRWFGTPADKIVGHTVSEILGQEQLQKRLPYIQTALQGERVTFETSFELPDGGELFTLSSYVPDIEGDVVKGFYVFGLDITARKAAEDALRESEARFRLIADTMPQIAWVTRPDGYHEYYNRRWYDYIGVDFEKSKGDQWADPLHPDDRERSRVRWQHSLETGEPYEIEYRFRRYDGEYRWFLGLALPARDAQGTIVKWYGTCTDIHEQKQFLEERDSLLESERAARGIAERASLMKDEFLATLSHELRTPLNAILGWSQLLKIGPTDPVELAEGLEVIERNAHSQAQIIEDLLDMSRIVSGKVRLEVRPLDLAAAVQAALATVRPAAESKGVRLQSVLDPLDGVAINGDANRLHQVFWNLLSNAVKFTPKAGRVHVVLSRVNSHVEISVNDTGEGIDPEFLPYVFDKFRQADASTTRRHGGLGLGLSIVKQLVELHGGSVRVHSEGKGQGSTFTVALPLMPLQPDALSDEKQRHPRAHGGAAIKLAAGVRISGLRVLVVDDEPDARLMVKRLLENHQAVVTLAATAGEALEALRHAAFDVLVSDIGMPREDGYSLIRKIRALDPSQGGHLPAIALTAYARAEDRIKTIAAGFQLHLVKPVDPVELVSMVAAISGRTGA
ncbi:hypothetical protein SAMN05421753_105153 [Planctomicrobium piriforme]|uniref:histidine kinase n=2 Tax=Planctomicrobium piriforme TaxID=1576369 RepID=A0A1I3FAP1_9PLAN|nr:hypothetical protein SAMN05421753_105153 [Planctomicrobium piriforme]